MKFSNKNVKIFTNIDLSMIGNHCK